MQIFTDCACSFDLINSLLQRSKLTFSKSHLLATFNCKMVATKNSVAKKNGKGRTLHDILHVAKNVKGKRLHDILRRGLM